MHYSRTRNQLFSAGTALMLGAATATAQPTYDVTFSGNYVLTITEHATSTPVIIAMVDGATPTPNDQTVFIPGDPIGSVTPITPSISGSPVDNGIDITYTFTNPNGYARPTGDLVIPGITGGLSGSALDTVRSRDFFREGKAVDFTVGTCSGVPCPLYVSSEYPSQAFAPTEFIHIGNYGIGVSVQYPYIDPAATGSARYVTSDTQYGHRIAVGLWHPDAWFSHPQRAWRVYMPLNARTFVSSCEDSSTTEGFVPAYSTRTYVVSVRVANLGAAPSLTVANDTAHAVTAQQDWLNLFAPYRDYFLRRYGGTQYTLNPTPVNGISANDASGSACTNNTYGYYNFRQVYAGSGTGYPYPDGWDVFHDYVMYLNSNRGWSRFMVWAPSGIACSSSESLSFAPPGCPAENDTANYPFQFASFHTPTSGHDASYLNDIEGSGRSLGLWWGHSTTIATAWNPSNSDVHALDPANSTDVSTCNGQLTAAYSTTNCSMIGLDDFADERKILSYKTYHWLKQMQSSYPQFTFIQESISCDILSTLSPGFVDAAGITTKTPHYLSEILLPGHEIWAQVIRNQGSIGGTDAAVISGASGFAAMDYVPVVIDQLDITGHDLSCQPLTTTIPCEMLTPLFITQPPSTSRHRSHDNFSISASVSSPAVTALQWQVNHGSGWSNVSDISGRIEGSTSATLHFISVRQSDGVASYRLRSSYTGACADVYSDQTALTVCASADFNHDGNTGTSGDFDDFFACLGGTCCPNCDTADFDGDGNVGTSNDISAFFSALSGNPC